MPRQEVKRIPRRRKAVRASGRAKDFELELRDQCLVERIPIPIVCKFFVPIQSRRERPSRIGVSPENKRVAALLRLVGVVPKKLLESEPVPEPLLVNQTRIFAPPQTSPTLRATISKFI